MLEIDKSWTLFLDRDGVINIENPDGYINHWEEFIFYPKAEEAIATISPLLYKTIIVTNQRGVGRGITLLQNLNDIHNNLSIAVKNHGGRIDGIYFCTDVDDSSPDRKPNTGMALKAKHDFPCINFSKSIMIGNNASDMEFGRNINVGCNIFLTTTQSLNNISVHLYDYHFTSLYAAASFIKDCVKS